MDTIYNKYRNDLLTTYKINFGNIIPYMEIYWQITRGMTRAYPYSVNHSLVPSPFIIALSIECDVSCDGSGKRILG